MNKLISFLKFLRNPFKRKKKNADDVKPEKSPEVIQEAPLEEKISDPANKRPRPARKPARRPAEQTEFKGREENRPPKERWDVSKFAVPEAEGKTRFHDFDLPAKLMRGIQDLGFNYCTQIQAEILPQTLQGKDATGQAQTGTGKSAAFLISIFTKLLTTPHHGQRRPGIPRALIFAPTRELALQVEKDAIAIGKHTRVTVMSVFGGMAYEAQKRRLAEKVVDVLIATPGRLLDFIDQGLIKLYKTEIIVIDEADRMLDMGFMPDMRQIMKSAPPKSKRQTLFFSATITPEVSRLAALWMTDSMSIEIDPEQVASATIVQRNYIVTSEDKFALLYNILTRENPERVIVFANTRIETKTIGDRLTRYGFEAVILSGDVPQKKRLDSLENFRSGKAKVLVATDVAARGLHIDAVSHVINYNFPQDPEHYVHRIGRTGRAGASGISISFACEDDSFYIPAAEKLLGNSLTFEHPDEEWLTLPEPPPRSPKEAQAEEKARQYPKSRPQQNRRSGSRPGQRPRQGGGASGSGRPQRSRSESGSGRNTGSNHQRPQNKESGNA